MGVPRLPPSMFAQIRHPATSAVHADGGVHSNLMTPSLTVSDHTNT